MSQILKLEIPDSLFAAIEREAVSKGSDAATIAMSTLKSYFEPAARPLNNQDGVNAFRAMFGAADLGHPTGLDNDRIDEDLVREYSHGLTD